MLEQLVQQDHLFRRFKGTDISEKIFDNIVLQAMEKGLVGCKILYSDSAHIKANANKRKIEV